MKKNHDHLSPTAGLRYRAEQRLKRQRPEDRGQKTELETTRLLHELEVHQIELEMQNEELEKARAKEEALLAQYTDLYDFAPTAYFTLAADGTILAANLTGARFLGIERAKLMKQRFGLLVSSADRPVFNACLEKVFAGTDRQCCEVALLRATTEPLFVRVEAVGSKNRRECRATVLDVTDRRRVELERERLILELQTALARVKQLSGLLPICANCKRIRNDEGYWNQVELYVSSQSEATFTHCICPECLHKLYPEQEQEVLGRTAESLDTAKERLSEQSRKNAKPPRKSKR
jgi:PAS domain S-box-containing protein